MSETRSEVRCLPWESLPWEPLKPGLKRRFISGDRVMLAQIHLEKGAEVPLHHHENEQITYVIEGRLKFWIGEEGAEEVIVEAGQVLHLPSNVPHRALALEDTLDVDAFSPPRQDWLDKTDDYLRNDIEG